MRVPGADGERASADAERQAAANDTAVVDLLHAFARLLVLAVSADVDARTGDLSGAGEIEGNRRSRVDERLHAAGGRDVEAPKHRNLEVVELERPRDSLLRRLRAFHREQQL